MLLILENHYRENIVVYRLKGDVKHILYSRLQFCEKAIEVFMLSVEYSLKVVVNMMDKFQMFAVLFLLQHALSIL